MWVTSWYPVLRKSELQTIIVKWTLISVHSMKNYFLSAWTRMCHVSDVNKTFHAVDIGNF